MSAQEYANYMRKMAQFKYWGEVFHRSGNHKRRDEMFWKHDEIFLLLARVRSERV